MNFKLPDLGEGLPDASIVAWHVKVGDLVKVDQALVSVETAKAIVDIPSPVNGVINALCAELKEIIKVGQDLVIFNVDKHDTDIINSEVNTLIGAIPATGAIYENSEERLNYKKHTLQSVPTIKASPAIRALAKKLQVDLSKIMPTGINQTISIEDLYKAKDFKQQQATLIDFNCEGWTDLNSTAIRMAAIMEKSHLEVVPATIFEDLIIAKYHEMNVNNIHNKFDITINLILAIAYALTKEPIINSWLVKHGDNFKHKVFSSLNLGIAVDSPDGLFVPVIKDASSKSFKQLREELDELLSKIKNRTIIPSELQEATFILSNFGKFAGKYALPVIVPPSVGILAVGKLRQNVLIANNEPKVSYMLPVSLTFDHRVITGGQAARFLRGILEYFE